MKLRKIILMALLLAAAIVINRFLSIKSSVLQISFTFIPLMMTAIILGPKESVIVATLADVIGALLFPFGAFFIGYTISALLTGLTYGLLLHQKKEFKVDKKFIIHLVIATLIVTLLINGGLNTLWISIQYKKAFIALASTRIVKELIMIPVMILAMLGLGKEFEKEINVTRND